MPRHTHKPVRPQSRKYRKQKKRHPARPGEYNRRLEQRKAS